MSPTAEGDLRQIVNDIYDYVQNHLYFGRPDLEVKGRRFNSALLFTLLTSLNCGKQIIIGEPGLGKTTSAEYVCCLIYRVPLATVWTAEVAGHPEQTEEKIIGRPDLGKLSQGEEVVVWSHFVLLPVKIVDEMNRLPETKQSIILDGVDRGNWGYLNESIINPEYSLFATANYQDKGTSTVIAPLLDRFDVMVESKHPGANFAFLVGKKGRDGLVLRDEASEEAFRQALCSRLPHRQRLERIEELGSAFAQALAQKHGIPSLSREDREEIRAQCEGIRFDLDANAFLRVVLAELSFCFCFGQKRSQEGCLDTCHFTGYLCRAVRNCISNRFPLSVRIYAQSLAWLLGDSVVDLEHVRTILPYALAHRIQWKEEVVAQRERDIRVDPLPIYLAKQAVADVHRRYAEQAWLIKDALAVASRIAEGEAIEPVQGDHPLFWEIRRDLGEEIQSE